jgi:hypothetical protein
VIGNLKACSSPDPATTPKNGGLSRPPGLENYKLQISQLQIPGLFRKGAASAAPTNEQ